MSRNVEIVQDIYAAFGRGDVPHILGRLSPDVEWEHDWGGDPLPPFRPGRGPAAAEAFFVSLAAFEFLHFQPMGFLADADMVCVPIHVRLRHKGTGRDFRDLEMHLWTIGADGLVSAFRHGLDTRQFAWTIASD